MRRSERVKACNKRRLMMVWLFAPAVMACEQQNARKTWLHMAKAIYPTNGSKWTGFPPRPGFCSNKNKEDGLRKIATSLIVLGVILAIPPPAAWANSAVGWSAGGWVLNTSTPHIQPVSVKLIRLKEV